MGGDLLWRSRALGLVGALGRATYPAVFAVGWIMFLANVGDTSDFFLAIVPLFLMFGAARRCARPASASASIR